MLLTEGIDGSRIPADCILGYQDIATGLEIRFRPAPVTEARSAPVASRLISEEEARGLARRVRFADPLESRNPRFAREFQRTATEDEPSREGTEPVAVLVADAAIAVVQTDEMNVE